MKGLKKTWTKSNGEHTHNLNIWGQNWPLGYKVMQGRKKGFLYAAE